MSKLPWDIPTSDRALYEPICAKSPEDRSPLEALAKKYIDLCAQAVYERDLNIARAIKAEQALADIQEIADWECANLEHQLTRIVECSMQALAKEAVRP